MSLDDALQAWAARVALPEPAADEIFEEIVTPSPGIDPQWWARFSTRLATTIVISTRPPRVFT